MSSLVSLRGYQKRRKSAGARLERVRSSSVASPGEFGSSGHERQASAFGARDYREKRVKSARETRREQEASDIFPELKIPTADPEWGKTKYSEDFCHKTVSPIHIRPISPTRMNNPHPSKVTKGIMCDIRIKETIRGQSYLIKNVALSSEV